MHLMNLSTDFADFVYYVSYLLQGLDVSRQLESSVKSSKPGSSKKMERKVAGSAINKGDKGSKPAAWK